MNVEERRKGSAHRRKTITYAKRLPKSWNWEGEPIERFKTKKIRRLYIPRHSDELHAALAQWNQRKGDVLLAYKVRIEMLDRNKPIVTVVGNSGPKHLAIMFCHCFFAYPEYKDMNLSYKNIMEHGYPLVEKSA